MLLPVWADGADFDAIRLADGEMEVGAGGAGGADLAGPVEGEERDLGRRDAAAGGDLEHPAHGRSHASCGGLPPRIASTISRLPPMRMISSPTPVPPAAPAGVIDVQAGADERRVADAARQLVRQPGRGADAAERALRSSASTVTVSWPGERRRLLAARSLGRRLLPLGDALGRQQRLQREALLQREQPAPPRRPAARAASSP